MPLFGSRLDNHTEKPASYNSQVSAYRVAGGVAREAGGSFGKIFARHSLHHPNTFS